VKRFPVSIFAAIALAFAFVFLVAAAELLLNGFLDRYPDSIFDVQAPEQEANVLLAMNNVEGARRVLAQLWAMPQVAQAQPRAALRPGSPPLPVAQEAPETLPPRRPPR